MELKMKAICEGRKNRREVVQESLDQYRDVYLRVQQQLPKLHEVFRHHSPVRSYANVARLYGNTFLLAGREESSLQS